MESLSQRQTILPLTESLGLARDSVAALLGAAGVAQSVIDDAQLVVTELLSNAMRHAEPPLGLEVSVADSGVVIEVADHSPELLPQQLPPDLARTGGWGMGILTAISSAWGVRTFPDHKVVWALLPATWAIP